jgi:hypothetical protein
MARSEAVAVRLVDGRAMVIGGMAQIGGNLVTLKTVEIYDANLEKWEQAAPMPRARYGHTANLLPGGLVLVVGGLEEMENHAKRYVDSVEVYNPVDGTWTPIASLETPRAYHTTTLLPDGRIFVAGGMSTEGLSLASTEILVVGRLAIENTPTPATTPGVEVTPTPETPSGGSASTVISSANVNQLVVINPALDTSVKDVSAVRVRV